MNSEEENCFTGKRNRAREFVKSIGNNWAKIARSLNREEEEERGREDDKTVGTQWSSRNGKESLEAAILRPG